MYWWQESVVYQIYPRSFKDSNHDGIGDLQGIISKLPYLHYLGVDMIWLCPVYASPNEDNGYDISDYFDIMRDFGSMADMDQLIAEAKHFGIGIMMDIVANHTSSEHAWFKEAKKSKNNPYHAYYIFKENLGEIPSDLQSIFLGSAWELSPDTNEFYLHMFAKGQPDLNWDHKSVRDAIYQILNWWMDKGIKGFRFDVIDMISKDLDKKKISDGPNLHTYITEMNQKSYGSRDVLTVGETWGATVEKALKYSNLDGSEFSMIFNFSHILLDQAQGKEKWDFIDLDLLSLKRVLAEQQIQMHGRGWNSLFWNNHDLPRIVSRWGNDKEYRVQSSKMFGTLSHFMQGTPYIYQGEELGMTNVVFEDLNDYRDIETFNMINQRLNQGYEMNSILDSIHKIGRDNARTPFQWSSQAHAGFSDVEPWIKVNPNYIDINVEKQMHDQDSVLEYYRKLIKLRKNSEYQDLIRDGDFELMYEDHPDVFAYNRKLGSQRLEVICNFHGKVITLPYSTKSKRVLLSNYEEVLDQQDLVLRPYAAIVLTAGDE
ncbi:MAG TPA: glucohydrolase [Erysipelotrichaceae bacterium]|nr:glucohydrolase [Erysipelotrichaceae bacterium]